MILLRTLHRRNLTMITSFYRGSVSDTQDPFRVVSVDKLLKLSASRKYNYPKEFQFYSTVLNSLMRRPQQLEKFRAGINQEFLKIMINAVKQFKQSNPHQFLRFSLIVFEGISKRVFFCDHTLLVQFMDQFKATLLNLVQKDKQGLYYHEIKKLTIYLLNLRKGSFIIKDIIIYLKNNVKNNQELIELISQIYSLSYKATGNLINAMQKLIQQSIYPQMQSISEDPLNHPLLDEVILKAFIKYQLHLKRPCMDIPEWMNKYISLLYAKYSVENLKILTSKKISFIKSYLRIFNDYPLASNKRQITEARLEDIPKYIQKLFNEVNSVDQGDTITKLIQFLSLLQIYKQFLFNHSFIRIQPTIITLHEIMCEIFGNFLSKINAKNYNDETDNIIKLFTKFVKVYLMFQNYCNFQKSRTDFGYLFHGFSHKRKNITNKIFILLYDSFFYLESIYKKSWEPILLLEPIALLASSDFIDKKVVPTLLEDITAALNTKISNLPFNADSMIKIALSLNYLGLSLPSLETIMEQQSLEYFQEYAISGLKGVYVLDYLNNLKPQELNAMMKVQPINKIACFLKPDDGASIDQQIYKFWFRQNEHAIFKMIQQQKVWVLLNVIFRFQFSKINATCIDFITELIRISYLDQIIDINQSPTIPLLVRDQINKIYRDQIVHNSLIQKIDGITEYKFIFFLTSLFTWNISVKIKKNQGDSQNYVNIRNIVDFIYFMIIDWKFAIRSNTFRTKFMFRIIDKIVMQCLKLEHREINFVRAASLQKIIQWAIQFDFLHQTKWTNHINLFSYFNFLKTKYSLLYCWDIILGFRQNNENEGTIQKLENQIINQQESKARLNQSSHQISFLKLYHFIKGNKDMINQMTDYELLMLLMHRNIVCSASDQCIQAALHKFFVKKIGMTYKQFLTFAKLIIIFLERKIITDQKLVQLLLSEVHNKFNDYCQNLPYKFLIDYFCLAQRFGRIQKVEIMMKDNISILFQKGNIDCVQFLFYRRQIVNEKDLEGLIQKIDSRNILRQFALHQNAIFKAELIFTYLYGLILLQKNNKLLALFYQTFIASSHQNQFNRIAAQVSQKTLERILLRQQITKMKLKLTQSKFQSAINKISPEILNSLMYEISEFSIKKQNLIEEVEKQQISFFKPKILKFYALNAARQGLSSNGKKISLSAEQQLMVMYLSHQNDD